MNDEQRLAAFRPWVRAVARRMTSGRMSRHAEDLAQEGWVAAWKVTRTWTGDAPMDYMMKMAAQRRMVTVLISYERQERGGRQGWSNPHGATVLAGALTEQDTEAFSAALGFEPGAIEWAYHHGEIGAALNALTPHEREYVWLRFYRGFDQPAMRAHYGYVPRGTWAAARRKLRAELAHLAP